MNYIIKKILLGIAIILFCLSLGLNGWLAYQLSLAVNAYKAQEMDAKVLEFTRMFVHDVLMAQTEIGFDTRLTLETSVRSLNDQDIFDQWQRFTKATTKETASDEAKKLLNLLVNRVTP